MERKGSLGEDLALTLLEFDDALQDFTRGPCDSEELLKNLKQNAASSLNSTCSDPPNLSSSRGSISKTNLEHLNYSVTNIRHQSKAKLGDTRELENFISDLDKVLTDF
ncbi:regulator of cell cycle RGCC-like isoform X2 [Hyperolius riggenbachi]|uniref:regulator of cell cycle RGCC-like isoform X2 n=1 Tax=Hyperolius riggenbachi TaxID=752182 RepID=UPI0035A29EFB